MAENNDNSDSVPPAVSDHPFSPWEICQYKLLKGLSRLLVRLPTPITACICQGLGNIVFFCFPKRRRIILRNLHHSFPHWSEARRRKTARRSCAQTIELGLLAIVAWAAPESWVRKRFLLSGQDAQRYLGPHKEFGPSMLLTPHLSLAEAQVCLSLLTKTEHRRMAAIYRPFKNRPLDWLVREGREKWGWGMLSRKEGFNHASAILRNKGMLGILFDQNAGDQGSLTPFMGRVASTTELPALLATRHRARYLLVWTERTGFWQGIIHIEDYQPSPQATGKPGKITLEIQQWLEDLLTNRLPDTASWLWLHNRWKTQHRPETRLRIEARRILALPDPSHDPARAARFWLRLPDDPALTQQLAPLLPQLQSARPDVLWHLTGSHEALKTLENNIPPNWTTLELPTQPLQRAKTLRSLRSSYPDLFLSLQPSTLSWEARLTGSSQSFCLPPSNPLSLNDILSFLHSHGLPQ